MVSRNIQSRIRMSWVRVLTAALLVLLFTAAAAGFRAAAAEMQETVGKTVVIRLKPNEGTVKQKKIRVNQEGTVGELPVPERKGYRFKGWYTKKKSGERITAETPVSSLQRRVLYAHWKILKYRIIVQYNGGTLPKGKSIPAKYKITTPTFRLPKPVRTGYVFKGWYTAKTPADGKRIKKIRKGSTGKLRLYAYFEPVTYTVRFKSNGVLKKAVRKKKVTYGESFKLPAPADPAFASWNTSPDGDGTQYSGGQTVSGLTEQDGKVITLYANPFVVGNNIKKLYDYFQRIGFTKEAAAGIVGNLMYESGGGYSDVKLNAVEFSTGRGIGMCQWTNTADMQRRTNFERFCASKGKPWPNQDLKVQVDFLMAELEGKTYGKVWYFLPAQGYPASYEMSLEKYRKLTDAAEATRVFCANFERPKPADANLTQRIVFARHVMENN